MEVCVTDIENLCEVCYTPYALAVIFIQLDFNVLHKITGEKDTKLKILRNLDFQL